MSEVGIILILSGLFIFVFVLLSKPAATQEGFLDEMLGLNKSIGQLSKNKKSNVISDKMNNFLSTSPSDITKKINELKKKIKENKTTIVTKKNVEDKDRTEIIKKKQTKKTPEPFMTASKLGAMGSCRFLSSEVCSKEYPSYMGASLGVPDDSGMKLKCNSDLMKPAKGLAIINNGKLEAIVMMDKGEGYKTAPKITITGGGGYNGECESYLDDLGAITRIKIVNPGYNYTGTPNINIELPSTSSSCYLCCKKMY
tara:strand:+ start:1633 stop:2397 length:765 start_codon:yes stop_codon:yes gene_type:complete